MVAAASRRTTSGRRLIFGLPVGPVQMLRKPPLPLGGATSHCVIWEVKCPSGTCLGKRWILRVKRFTIRPFFNATVKWICTVLSPFGLVSKEQRHRDPAAKTATFDNDP